VRPDRPERPSTRARPVPFLLAALLVCAACGGSDPTRATPEPEPPTFPGPPATLTLVGPDSAALLLDDSSRATVRVADARGRAVPAAAVTWSTGDPAVAVLGTPGAGAEGSSVAIMARGVGTTVVTASTSGPGGAPVTTSVRVTVAPQFADIAAGGGFACGITGFGRLFCWGDDTQGQLGLGVPSGQCSAFRNPCAVTPKPVALAARVVAVRAGEAHACALDAAGAAFCWGGNARGQLGAGIAGDRSATPLAVAGGHRFASITPGREHTCGLTTGGAALCWGSDRWGQLGGGATAPDRCEIAGTREPCARTPVAVAGGRAFVALAATERATCGLTSAGEMLCWGGGVGGRDAADCQGGEQAICSRVPIANAAGERFTALGVGPTVRCGRTDAGTLRCWGSDVWGYFGNGNAAQTVERPVTAAGGLRLAAIHVGWFYMCGLDDAGAAFCWGQSTSGQVGDGLPGRDVRPAPTPVAGGLRFARLSVPPAGASACAVTRDGRGFCWGDGRLGGLGNGGAADAGEPARVATPR
jgi:alpha-tubulin suppressor-like RCC1 family protein